VIRTVTLAPGTARGYVDGEWAGALVVLARGRLELEARDGRRISLRSGAVLWLAGLPLRALHNRDEGTAVLMVVTRDAAPADGPGNAGRGRGVLESMTLPLLILFAAGTLLPCLGLWLADERARLQDR
jgi:hypothetical protein